MSTIVVQAFITLDGVVQADDGTPDNGDAGFAFGNWPVDYDAEHGGDEMNEIVQDWESRTEALLLGRRTYEIWANSWGVWDEDAEGLDGEFTRKYNRVPKYIASRTLTQVGWQNSHLLGPGVPAAVRKVRDELTGELRVWGSTKLIRTLADNDLIDEYRLAVYPLVLGSGTRLFPPGFPVSRLKLETSRTLDSGVLINTYGRSATA